jgi:2-succinyl-5-enolpyruvyl-6-hydroxy-3-cyclohexene-1-carboxylate synthase
MFASGSAHPLTVYANRGASGIDGILASAVGCALTVRRPMTVLIGDLSLLHDLSSFGLLGQVRRPLVIILLNNDGGGIFHLLPVPRQDNLLERYFQLPHGFSFAGVCEMFGVTYACPDSRQAFTDCYTLALREPRATVIEAKVPPGQAAVMIQDACRDIGAIRIPTEAGPESDNHHSTP